MRGLTGGIATGKSTVAAMLTDFGAKVLDADQIARQVVEPNTQGWEEVRRYFPEIIQTDFQIDRKKLGQIIFRNSAKRQRLEQIVHPLVIATIQEQGHILENDGHIVFADIPLLYETKSDQWLTEVWVVYVDQDTQLQRLMERDEVSLESARQRVLAQLSIDRKRELADVLIDNRGSVEHTKEQVREHWQNISYGL